MVHVFVGFVRFAVVECVVCRRVGIGGMAVLCCWWWTAGPGCSCEQGRSGGCKDGCVGDVGPLDATDDLRALGLQLGCVALVRLLLALEKKKKGELDSCRKRTHRERRAVTYVLEAAALVVL